MTYTPAPAIYGGHCQLHYKPLPCSTCTSDPQLPWIPSLPPYQPYQPQQPYLDPWMPQGQLNNLSPLPPFPLYGYRFVPSECDHCFCEYHEAEIFGGIQTGPDHEGCCNCGTRRAISPISHEVSAHVLDDLRDAGFNRDEIEWDHDAFLDD